MHYIGNILTNNIIDVPMFNVVSNKTDIIDGIPTIVIGKDFSKSLYPERSIIDKVIDFKSQVFWTFGKRERRSSYESDMKWFKDFCLEYLRRKCRYVFFDLLTNDTESKSALYEMIMCEKGVTAMIYGDMVYVYNPCEEHVVGLYLKDVDYLKKDRKRLLSIIYNSDNVRLIDNKEVVNGDDRMLFFDCMYVIPYIFS